ncbi:hypothetical protein FOZ62_022452, partial [Perkinsus olseni]
DVFTRSPVLANSVTSLACYALSDLMAQRADDTDIRRSVGVIDRRRLLSVALCGPILSGICLTKLYRNLDRFLGSGHTFRVASRKILFMQIVYMPFSVPAFIFLSSTFNALFNGETITIACTEASAVKRQRWKEAYWTSWF